MKSILSLALAILVAVSLPLVAQTLPTDRCDDSETIPTCLGRLAKGVSFDENASVAKQLAEANTGVPTLDSPLGSSLKDFLSLFVASVDMATLSESDDGALTLDWNFGAKQFTNGRPFKLQTVFHKPQLDTRINTALTGELLAEKEGSLEDTDDVSVSLSYSPQRRAIGRTLAPHRQLFEMLTGIARNMAEPAPDPVKEASDASKLAAVIAKFQNEEPIKSDRTLTRTLFKDYTAQQKLELGPLVAAAAAEQVAIGVRYDSALKAVGADKFRELLHQQPQAYASIVTRSRNELVGADELSFKVTYETSGRGLRKFYKGAKSTCDDTKLKQAKVEMNARQQLATSPAATACLSAWNDFLADETTRAAMASSGRFAFSVEYAGVDALNVEIPLTPPADPFRLQTKDQESLIGSVTYGLVLNGKGGPREGKFDLKASYENVTGDADRDNRFVASAVFSQKLSDTLTLPLGISYANQPRYLGAISDKGATMHFGLIYKIPAMGDQK